MLEISWGLIGFLGLRSLQLSHGDVQEKFSRIHGELKFSRRKFPQLHTGDPENHDRSHINHFLSIKSFSVRRHIERSTLILSNKSQQMLFVCFIIKYLVQVTL